MIAEKAINKWMYHGRVNKLALSPDGKKLYIAWRGAWVFDTERLTFQAIPLLTYQAASGVKNPDGSPVWEDTNLALTPDGQKLYVYQQTAPVLNVVATQSLSTLKTIFIPDQRYATDLIVSQGGKKLFLALAQKYLRPGERILPNKVLIFNTLNEQQEKTIDTGVSEITRFLTFDDGPMILALSRGRVLQTFDDPSPVISDVVEYPDLLIDAEKGEIVGEVRLSRLKNSADQSMIHKSFFYTYFFQKKQPRPKDIPPSEKTDATVLTVFDLKDGNKVKEILLPFFSFHLSDVIDDRWLYIMRKQSILLVDLQQKKVVKEVDIYNPSLFQRVKGRVRPDYTENMVLSKDGKRLYVAGLLFQQKWTPFFDLPPPPVKLVITIVDAEKMRRNTE
ncbi:MAG: YncE family protein [Candidatus Methylomirabilales bacterium]